MIYLDVTRARKWRHHSGLNRVSTQLRQHAGPEVSSVEWPSWSREASPEDCFLTSELFSEAERPGLVDWLGSRRMRSAAIFHDAIPLRHPSITWSKSVARHAEYVKTLAQFDDVLAVSADSARDLQELWRWQGVQPRARVRVVVLGADGLGGCRGQLPASPPTRTVVATGILEPRKNQTTLLDAAEQLWRRGRFFRVVLVGRVNSQYGASVVQRIAGLQRAFPGLLVHERRATDTRLRELLDAARCTAFPSLAEGCGLPVLESLWAGRPCLASEIEPVRESARGGGCELLSPLETSAWANGLERMLFDDAYWWSKVREAVARPLPCWSETAAAVWRACR